MAEDTVFTMTASSPKRDSMPRVILYVYALIAIVVLAGSFTITVIWWSGVQASRIEQRASGYHLMIIGGADRIEREIFFVQRGELELLILAQGANDGQHRDEHGSYDFTAAEFVNSLHVIGAEVESLRELQAHYHSADYESTSARVFRQFKQIADDFGAHRSLPQPESEAYRYLDQSINAFLISITQLKKLHSIAYDEIVGSMAVQRQEDTRSLAFLLFVSLGMAGFVVFRLLRLIGQSLDRQKRIEDALVAGEQVLQERIADLEEAQRKLEMQGESLTRLADDLLIARNEATAADQAKSEFLAAMSHELRTPMNAILGFSEIIKDEKFGPVGTVKYRDYAGDIHDSGKHLLGLINDILDLSKIESGTDDLFEDNIEIPKIVHSALKLVEQRAKQGAIKIQIEIAGQVPALRADERKLKQILVNLLSNAIKFSYAGGEVALWAWCRMGRGHVFQIIDTGIGIAPEDIPKALSRFGQVDADLNRQFEGTGLGLTLTKSLVEQHGGTLDLQSQAGIGTTVMVRFPAARIVHSPHDAKSVNAADRNVG